MKDRIKQIMDSEQLSPSAFADKLQIGRAVISHILNGRNNPSLEIVTRILSKMSNINPDWLLTGNGQMYKSNLSNEQTNAEQTTLNNNFSKTAPDLFSISPQDAINPSISKEENEYRKENIVNQPQIREENINNQQIIYQKSPEKKISKIIIYYTDNTFEAFNVENKPF